MKLETGTIILVISAAIFYLRLVWINRQHMQRGQSGAPVSSKKKGKGKKPENKLSQYWILSPYRRDWIIGGIGVLLMVFGILLYTAVLPMPQVSDYWWIPLSAGILLFSFTFR